MSSADSPPSLHYSASDWVIRHPSIDHDIMIIGAGQTGLALAAGLQRAGVRRVGLVESHPDPDHVGIWDSTARMHKLRTLKSLPGPEMSEALLSYQTWYEARHGQDAYQRLDRIGRSSWAQYLRWFAVQTSAPIRRGVKLADVNSVSGGLELSLVDSLGAQWTERCRHLVVATGFAGSGSPVIPAAVKRGLPASAYRHTSEPIDLASLSGRRVAVIGAAASAFDIAASALENGAVEVRMLCRANALPGGARWRHTGFKGYAHFYDLPDAQRWELLKALRARAVHPPADSVERATRHANFHLHLGAHVVSARTLNGDIVLETSHGPLSADELVLGTGYRTSLDSSGPLSNLAPRILKWGQRYQPPPHAKDDDLAAHPYLGPRFECLGTDPTDREIGRIVCCNQLAFASFGRIIGDVPSMGFALPRIVNGLCRALFLEDAGAHVQRIATLPLDVELPESAWRPSVWEEVSP